MAEGLGRSLRLTLLSRFGEKSIRFLQRDGTLPPLPDPTAALDELAAGVGRRRAAEVMIEGTVSPAELDQLTGATGADSWVQRAILTSARAAPRVWASWVVEQILAGGITNTVSAVMPHVAPALTPAEADDAFSALSPHLAVDWSPYRASNVVSAVGAASALVAEHPSLLPALLALTHDPAAAPNATEVLLSAIGEQRLVTARDHLVAFAGRIASSLGDLISKIERADSRYSAAQPVVDRIAPYRRRLLLRAPERQFFAVLASALGAWVLTAPLQGMGMKPASPGGFAEPLTALGLLVAVHVLAVQLSIQNLPASASGLIGTPARLLAAYALVVLWGLGAFTGTLLTYAALILLALVGPSAIVDLTRTADLTRASRRLAGRALDQVDSAVTQALIADSHAQLLRDGLDLIAHVSRVMSIPASRRGFTVVAAKSGYLRTGLSALVAADSWIERYGQSDSKPHVHLLHSDFRFVSQGEPVAFVAVDEPDAAKAIGAILRQAFSQSEQQPLTTLNRSVEALTAVMDSQSRQSDTESALRTSELIVTVLSEFFRRMDDERTALPPGASLDRVAFPLSPERAAVLAFEVSFRRELTLDFDHPDSVLNRHMARLAELGLVFSRCVLVELLVARLGGIVADLRSSPSVTQAAAAMSGLALAAATRGHSTYFSVRTSLAETYQALVLADPAGRIPELVRQRFEEALTFGLVADYGLDADVRRGLSQMATSVNTLPVGNKVAGQLGLVKVGARALQLGRTSLALRALQLLRAQAADWEMLESLAGGEDFKIRQDFLSRMAGGLFGIEVSKTMAYYCVWARRITAALPA